MEETSPVGEHFMPMTGEETGQESFNVPVIRPVQTNKNSCAFCPRRFGTVAGLARHEKIHVGRKFYDV